VSISGRISWSRPSQDVQDFAWTRRTALRQLTATSHDAPAANSPDGFRRGNAVFAPTEHKEHTNMKPKNTICLWFDKDAHEAARIGWGRS
jgi:hypothetical protein